MGLPLIDESYVEEPSVLRIKNSQRQGRHTISKQVKSSLDSRDSLFDMGALSDDKLLSQHLKSNIKTED